MEKEGPERLQIRRCLENVRGKKWIDGTKFPVGHALGQDLFVRRKEFTIEHRHLKTGGLGKMPEFAVEQGNGMTIVKRVMRLVG